MAEMDSHLNFRVSLEDKKKIEIAAKLKGLKSNTYARQKLLEAAEKDIAELRQSNVLILDAKDWEQFVKTMEEPIKVNKNLKNAVKEFRKMFG